MKLSYILLKHTRLQYRLRHRHHMRRSAGEFYFPPIILSVVSAA